jgi:3-phytase
VADDVCVWLHPLNASRSLIIGVNKSETRHGGLYVFQLDGSRWPPSDGWREGINWFAPGKKLNNVDALRGFAAGADRWDIVCAANRTDRALDVLRFHTNAAGDFVRLELVGRVPIGRGFASGTDAPYGLALYAWAEANRCFAFTSDKHGRLAQYELKFRPGGHNLSQVVGQRFDQGGQPWQISEKGCEIEGIVADSERGVVYIGSENEGIFRYRLQDGVMDPNSKVVVDRVSRRLKADVEGLTLYARADGSGYLLASSQGSDQFAVYQREFAGDVPNRHLTNFKIGASGRIDAVTSTDGIDAVSANLGGPLSEGLFIVHDGGGASPTNYKIVPWERIAAVIAGRR